MEPDFEKQELIPAIVQDFKTNEVLMLAYVNRESYKYMLETGETYFYSRSRNELWHKGETSGNTQKVKGMYLDCDSDSLLVLVEPKGPACHTGNNSCFFKEIIKPENNNQDILNEVFNMIKDRDVNPMEKSYTNYLLKEGLDKICKKVGEEATEVVIAAKNNMKTELTGEICDLIYHVLVLMYNQNVTLDDVEQKLVERHKVDGNKKFPNKRGSY